MATDALVLKKQAIHRADQIYIALTSPVKNITFIEKNKITLKKTIPSDLRVNPW